MTAYEFRSRLANDKQHAMIASVRITSWKINRDTQLSATGAVCLHNVDASIHDLRQQNYFFAAPGTFDTVTTISGRLIH
ncbi:hypothetical protein X777_05487 [Ooceraea biroi]|uniref:Uncharacterized protein n=1 Tax=Ooceraea biroi TaxID=2015173 RepID=A0A026WEX3_OOCBI|nr:hypothetical protein X777_05487 [Ooceraea biroi]